MHENCRFFGTQVSKLILGDNPVHGHSYIEDITPGSKMMDYYTADNFLKLLRHAEELGINAYLGLANDLLSACGGSMSMKAAV